MLWDSRLPLAVMPVLVGPLQVLLALLPAMLLAFGGALLALFKPSGLRKLGRFLWHQKVFSACLLLLGLAVWQGYPRKLWSGMRNALGLRAAAVTESASAGEWPTSRGGPHRTGYAGGDEPTSAGNQWAWNDHKTVFSSPTVAGDRVYFTTVTGIGPFTPTGKGAVVCVDAASGRELWRYEGDDGDLRGTFSSPAIGEGRLVVGEGLHQTSDARVTCLDLSGRKLWDFRTSSHVESTPCIHAGRVYVAAAGDGFYCFDLKPDAEGKAQVLWHLTGDRYLDCESSAVSDGETVWFGLGEEGNAIVAVNATDGTERWRVATPYPVFAAPTLVQDESGQGKIYIGMGNGNFVFSADELRAAKVESMRDEGKSAEEIAAAEKTLATAGAVWSIDAARGEVEWKHALPDTVLDSIAYQPSAKAGDPGRLYFGSRDGHAYALSADGKPLGKWNAGSPILASPALARQHVYFATKNGRLFALKSDTLQPVWDMTVQQSGTLTSSPAVAEGRVFIGTEDRGLRCVGTNEPPRPPMWVNVGFGGMTDDTPLPDEAEIAWSYLPKTSPDPSENRSAIHAATVLPLGDSVFCVESTVEGKVGQQRFSTQLVRLRLEQERDRLPRPVWSAPAPNIFRIGGTGDLIVAHSGDQRGKSTVTAYDVNDGAVRWKIEIATQHEFGRHHRHAVYPFSGGGFDSAGRRSGFALDDARVYYWSGFRGMSAASLESGLQVWNREKALGDDVAGSPTIVDDVVFGSAGKQLVAMDAQTGTVLWAETLADNAMASPTLCGSFIVAPLGVGAIQGVHLFDRQKTWRFQAEFPLGSPFVSRWEGVDDRLIVRARNHTIILEASTGSRLFELRGKTADTSPREPSAVRPPDPRKIFTPPPRQRGDSMSMTWIQRRSDLLVLDGSELRWWNPEIDSFTRFADLRECGQVSEFPVSHDGCVYVVTEKRGIVCLRGVTP